MIDLSPAPRVLEAMKNANFRWAEVFGELIDNAFDAGATSVQIVFGPGKRVAVSDDGIGCQSMEEMLTIGVHSPKKSNRLGRYGVGLKDAACWLWGKLIIMTTHQGIRRKIAIDWAALSKQSNWSLPDPTESASGRIGTELIFEGIQRTVPPIQPLIDELGFVFTPGLTHGKHISILHGGGKTQKRSVCLPYALPGPLEDVVDEHFEVNGKAVHLVAGVVPEGVSHPRGQGFIFYHGHRVIVQSPLGAMNYSVTRIAGRVHLGRGWDLSKNKTAISDKDHVPLGEEIFRRCKPMLEKAGKQATILKLEQLGLNIQDKLRRLAPAVNVKESRKKIGDSNGSAKPMNTSRIRRIVSAAKKGKNDLLVRAASGLLIEWNDEMQDGVMGIANISDIPRVQFNLSHPWIKQMKEDENDDALAIAALSLFVGAVFEDQEQSLFAFARDFGSMGKTMSEITRSMPERTGPRLSVVNQ